MSSSFKVDDLQLMFYNTDMDTNAECPELRVTCFWGLRWSLYVPFYLGVHVKVLAGARGGGKPEGRGMGVVGCARIASL